MPNGSTRDSPTATFSSRPVAEPRPIPTDQKKLSADAWRDLLALGHHDKAAAFQRYARYYLTTDGQRYWSDTHQLGIYDADYDEHLRQVSPDYTPGSLMITEAYVPRARLSDFMVAVAEDGRRHAMDVIYGTIRLIAQDGETFLPWARQDYACVIFNLRVEHSDAGIAKAQSDFQRLIDRALERLTESGAEQ